MKKFLSLTKIHFKEVVLSPPLFLQFLYALRSLWWGIGLLFFDFFFHVGELNHFNNIFMQLSLIFFGIFGIAGPLFKKYYLSISFSLFNVFFLGMISLTYLRVIPNSISGVSYVIDTIAGIWLLFRIQYDRAKNLRAKQFIQESLDAHEDFSSNPNKFE